MQLLLASILLAAADGPIDFDTDVMPVFALAGCNAGACHGGAAGRGGFKLSLFGASPAADHVAITREHEGRRIDLLRPAAGLLLRKPTGALDHGGDVVLDLSGPGAALLERWIAAGARRLELRRLTGLEVEPEHLVARSPGESLRVRVHASFDDGSRRDVTAWAVFTSSDPAALAVSGVDPGLVTVRRGETVLVVRYLTEVRAVRITVPIGSGDVEIPPVPDENFIDAEVDATLRALRLPPAPPADDATFLRRARLALTGRLPLPSETREFLAGGDPGKRGALVDRLLASADFVDYWTWRLADILRVRALETEASAAFRGWLRQQVENGASFAALTQALLTATGDSHERGEAAFYRMTGTARETAEVVSEVFLGVRLRCANCHDHPLDRWTQDDYHGLAAVFARLDRGRVVRLKDRGEVTHPATGEPAVPRLPGESFLRAADDPRLELAAWITSPSNPYFAPVVVNRLWRELMGRGLVQPVDDLRATNPATHPALLERLAGDFAAHGFDLRRTLRLIASSRAFARDASAGGAGDFVDDRYYSCALVRPLPAAVLIDALGDVTGVPESFAGQPAGTRAIGLLDPSTPSVALDLLGRCRSGASCEGKGPERGIAAALHLLNGPVINEKIASPAGHLARLLAAGASDADIVEDLYLRALSRAPRAEERDLWTARLAGAEDEGERKQRIEDFAWGLLNSREFVTNH